MSRKLHYICVTISSLVTHMVVSVHIRWSGYFFTPSW